MTSNYYTVDLNHYWSHSKYDLRQLQWLLLFAATVIVVGGVVASFYCLLRALFSVKLG